MMLSALQQVAELVNGKPRLANDRPQRAAIEFVVIGDAERRGRLRPLHDHMAATLAYQGEASLRQGDEALGLR